jgi:hypothetical protein
MMLDALAEFFLALLEVTIYSSAGERSGWRTVLLIVFGVATLAFVVWWVGSLMHWW